MWEVNDISAAPFHSFFPTHRRGSTFPLPPALPVPSPPSIPPSLHASPPLHSSITPSLPPVLLPISPFLLLLHPPFLHHFPQASLTHSLIPSPFPTSLPPSISPFHPEVGVCEFGTLVNRTHLEEKTHVWKCGNVFNFARCELRSVHLLVDISPCYFMVTLTG